MKSLRGAIFEFRTREEAAAVAQLVARVAPHRLMLELALLELMINAVEHGNLELGGDEKRALIRQNALHIEIAWRLTQPPYAERKAHVAVEVEDDVATIVIRDEGRGFRWRQTIDPLGPCGRGLCLVHAAGLPLTYNEVGNVVTAKVPL